MKKKFTINHIDEGNRGYFIATKDGKRAGIMTYVKVGDNRFIIDHTEVDDEFGGLGIGKAMFNESVAFARENYLQIIPLCPFAKAMFNKDTSNNDVLYKP